MCLMYNKHILIFLRQIPYTLVSISFFPKNIINIVSAEKKDTSSVCAFTTNVVVRRTSLRSYLGQKIESFFGHITLFRPKGGSQSDSSMSKMYFGGVWWWCLVSGVCLSAKPTRFFQCVLRRFSNFLENFGNKKHYFLIKISNFLENCW